MEMENVEEEKEENKEGTGWMTEQVSVHAAGSTHFPPTPEMEFNMPKPRVRLNCETEKMSHFPLMSPHFLQLLNFC